MAEGATSGGGLLGTLYIRLTAQNEELDKKMDDSEKKVSKSTKAMEHAAESLTHVLGALGIAFGLHQVISFVEDVIKGTDELKKFSQELGIGIDKLAGLKFAADKANIGESFQQGMRKFAEGLREAQVEGSAAETLFKNILEIDPKQGVDQAFDQVIEKFSQWEDGVNKMGVAQELFGTRNARFINLLSQGTEGIKKDVEELAKITGMSYAEAAEKSAQYEDATTTLRYSLQGLAMEFINTALPSVTEFKAQIAENLPVLKEFAHVLGEGVPFVLKLVVTSFKGFLGAMKVVDIFLIDIAQTILEIVNFIEGQFVQAWEFWANAAIKSINFVLNAFNSMADKLPAWVKERLGITGGQAVKPLELFSIEKPENMKKMDEWIDILHDTREELADQLAKDFGHTAEVIREGNAEVKAAVESGPGGKNALGNAPNVAVLKDVNSKLQDFTGDKQFTSLHGSLATDVANATGIAGFGEQTRMQEETKAVEEQLKEIQKIRDSHIKLTDEQNVRLTELERLYAAKRQAIAMNEMHLRLNTAQSMFGDLAEISKAWAGEQSGIYKTMFAISKAFAIADATVKIAQGIAAAAANPWPLNLFAMASVIAATASIVSSIQSVQLEFGGARAEGGSVDPNHSFLVGEEGPEMFVPRSAGTIIPNGGMGRGGPPKVIVNNYTDAQPTVTNRNDNGEEVIEIMVKRVSDRIGSDVRDGRGSVNKALSDSFGLRRGRGQ